MSERRVEPTPAGAAAAPAAAARPRGCIGYGISAGFGCLAFFAGAILAVVLLAPQLLGGWAARAADAWSARYVDGDLSIGDVELAWRDDQRLRDVELHRADGRRLLLATVRIPSLSDLVAGRDAALWRVRTTLQSATLTLDKSGVLDLARCFYLDAARPPSERVDLLAELWRRLERVGARTSAPFLCELDARLVEVIDQRATSGEPTRIEELRVELGRATRDGPATLACECRMTAPDGASGTLALELAFAAPEASRPSKVLARLECKGLPPAAAGLVLDLLRAVAPAAVPSAAAIEDLGGLAAICGQGLDASFLCDGDLQSGARVELAAASPDGAARLAGRVETGTFVLDDAGEPARVDWAFPAEIAPRRLAPLLPAGWRASAVAEPREGRTAPPRWSALVDSLVFEAGFSDGWTPSPEAFARTLELSMDARLPLRLTVEDAGGAAAPLVVVDPTVSVRALGAMGGAVHVEWRDEGTATVGALTMHLDDGRIDVDLPGLPTALLAAATPLPPDAAAYFGDAIRLQLRGIPSRGGSAAGRDAQIEFGLFAGKDPRPIVGHFERGVAHTRDGLRQTLVLPATRDTLARVIPPLFPWIASAEPVEGGDVQFWFEGLDLPLGGEGIRPDGKLEVALPALEVRLAQGVSERFSLDEPELASTWAPRRIALELDPERVEYPAVEIPLASHLCTFKGSYDRRDGVLDLQGEVPATLVQDLLPDAGTSALLQDSEQRVYVNLSGAVDGGRIFVDAESVRDMLQRTFERAAGALGDLIKREPGSGPGG